MFRFTIRDVLWLTALVAIGAGWWVARQSWRENLFEERRERNAQILKLRESRDQAQGEAKQLREQLKAIAPGE